MVKFKYFACWGLAVLALLLGIFVRYELYYSDTRQISHDETLSIIFAQGNNRRFNEAVDKQGGAWTPAREWKRSLYETNKQSFRGVAEDLAAADMHPPLYFWLLRIWIKSFGADNARLLNIPISILAWIALLGFARGQLSCRLAAALAGTIWILDPQAIRVSGHVRQYELLALLAILTAWQAARLAAGNRKWIDIAGFCGAALAGMLTHYSASLFILTGLIIIAIEARPVLTRVVPGLVVAAGLFIVIHPQFYRQLGQGLAQGIFWGDIEASASALLSFYGWRSSWTSYPIAIVILVLASVGSLAAVIWIARRRDQFISVGFFAFPMTAAVGMHILGISPYYAMGARYLSFAWPFLAVLTAAVLHRLSAKLAFGALAAIALAAGPAMLWVAPAKKDDELVHILSKANKIVIDDTRAGNLLRFLKIAPDDSLVYAKQDLAKSTDWLDVLDVGDIIVLHDPFDPNRTIAGKIAVLLATKYRASIKFQRYNTTILGIDRRAAPHSQ